MVLALPALAAAVAVVLEALLMAILIALIICAILYLLYVVIKYIAEWVSTTAPPMTPTVDDTWDDAIPYPPPAIPWPENGLEKINPQVLDKVKELLKTIALTEALTRGPWNVYDVHVSVAGKYRDYTRGQGHVIIPLSVGEIYKYGITKKASVLARYAEAMKHANNDKDQYIYGLLNTGLLAPLEWYLFRYNYAVARALENALISGYVALKGKFPPGNTGYY